MFPPLILVGLSRQEMLSLRDTPPVVIGEAILKQDQKIERDPARALGIMGKPMRLDLEDKPIAEVNLA